MIFRQGNIGFAKSITTILVVWIGVTFGLTIAIRGLHAFPPHPSFLSQAEDDEAESDDAFTLEFKKIFGSGQKLNLTAPEYLKQLVSGRLDDQQFKAQIERLGSDEYGKRQAAEAYLFSVPVFPEKYRRHIDENPDMEVRYRLKSIFEHRKGRVESLLVAALLTIAEERITSSLPDVFLLLGSTESAAVAKSATKTIRSIVDRSQESLLSQQLRSPSADIRLLVAQLVLDLKLDQPVQRLGFLLEDPSDRVRLQVATLLLDLNEKNAFRTLVNLLTSDSVSIASRAERILRAVTEQEYGNISYSDKNKNRQIAAAWKKWQDENLVGAVLRLPLKDYLRMTSRLNGNTLIAKDSTVVIELDVDRNEVFRMQADGVLSAEKTAEGNYLLFSYSGQWLKEFSPEKKLVWEITGVKFNNAMPLGNGNVLASVGPNSVVREIDPKTKKTVWEYKTTWWPNDAYRLENGNTLIGGKGGVVEVTPDKKVVWELKNPDSATIVVAKATENNGILIGWTNGMAKEMTRDKKVIWEYKAPQLSDVFRDANGHTFIATSSQIIELDAEKKIVWKMPKQSKTATVRR